MHAHMHVGMDIFIYIPRGWNEVVVGKHIFFIAEDGHTWTMIG